MNSTQIKEIEKEHIMQTYGRLNVVIDHGNGCLVYDTDGKEYLDFLGGIATCSVGHRNIAVSKAVCAQVNKLIGISNLLYTEPQVLLAEKLSRLSGLGKCFFCNSGAEANETAIKLAKKITKKKKFIAFEGSFHGRTTASLSVTWNSKYKEPFVPLAPEVIFAKYDDIESLKCIISNDFAAVIIEPIQGEAGIIVPQPGYLKEIEKLCRENGVLLIVDEVQSGTGRTGKFFAFLHEQVKPDIVTLAKGLANGIPIGVCMSDYDFDKGDHASTFGGNNLSCTAANAAIDYIIDNRLMENADTVGNYFMNQLKQFPAFKLVRGKGLMIGAELYTNTAKEVTLKCLEKGLLVNNVTETTLRFLPPLIVSKKDVDKAISILENVL